MSLPVFRAVTAKSAGTGATSVALPSGTATGDICVLVATTITGNTISITTAGGGAWTQLTGSPIDTTAGERLYVWWRRHAGVGDTAPTVTPSGDHVCGGMIAYSNCVASGDPVHVVTTSSEAASDTSYSFVTGLTSTINDVMAVSICSNGTDSNTATIGTQANASLASLNTRMDYCTTSGLGGGFGYADGTKVTAGTLGTWSSTLSTASPKAYIGFALLGTTILATKANIGIAPFTGGGADAFTAAETGIAISNGDLSGTFPLSTSAVIDSFTRADTALNSGLGTGWSGPLHSGAVRPHISSNQVSSNTISSNSGEYMTAGVGPNNERYYTLTATPGGGMLVYARVSSPNNVALNGYAVSWDSGAFLLQRWTADVPTTIATGSVADPATGDKLGLRCYGSRIEGWYYDASGTAVWTLGASATDTTYTPSAGVNALKINPNNKTLDDWSGGAVPAGFTGGGVSTYVPFPGYIKSGAGVSAFTGSGADAVTSAEAGTGISAFTGGGADAATPSRTGAGISGVDSPAPTLLDNFNRAAEDPLSGGGNWARLDSSLNSLQVIANQATSSFLGTSGSYWTPTQFTDVEVSAVIGIGPAGFVNNLVIARIQSPGGAGTWDGYAVRYRPASLSLWKVVDSVLSVALASTSNEGPTLVANDRFAIRCVGTTIEGWVYYSGGWRKLLSTTDSSYASGYTGIYTADTNLAFDDFSASVPSRNGFTGSGADATTYVESGTGISVFAGSGADATTFGESGTGVAPFTGGGAKEYTAAGAVNVKAGSATSEFTGSGADIFTAAETGTGIAPFVASGADEVTDVESGTGTSPFTGGGADASTSADSGTGVAPFTGTGSKAQQFTKSNTGVSEFTGSGADVSTSTEAGTGVSAFTGSGADVLTSVESGTGISPFSGDGSDELTYTESGTGTSPFVASGADAITFVESGTGVSEFTGASPGDETQDNAGTGVSAFTGSGADATTFVESGTGVAPFSGSGSDVATLTRSGTGVAPFSGGGTSNITGGTEYQKFGEATVPFAGSGADVVVSAESGAGIAPFTGSGARALVFTKTGAGVAVFSGSGADAFTTTDTGTGVSDRAGSGADAFTASDTGTGVAPFTGSGADATTSSESGTGAAPFTGSGSDVKTLSRSGTGVAPFTGSGVGNTSGDHAGVGIAPFSGAGSRAILFTKTGSCVSTRDGSGTDVPVYAERGAGVIDTTGGGVADKERAATGTGVAPFTGGGAMEATLTAQMYVEAGTGILVFSGRGKGKKPHLKGYGNSTTVAATGADTDIENASGSASTS